MGRTTLQTALALAALTALPFLAPAQDAPAAAPRFTERYNSTTADEPATAYCDFGRKFSFQLFSGPIPASEVDVHVETTAAQGTWTVDGGVFTYAPRAGEIGSVRRFDFTLRHNGREFRGKTIYVQVKSKFLEITGNLLKGLVVSIEIFLLTLCFALPLGLLIAFGRMSKVGFVRQIFRIYISIMRGTPLMLQLFFFYFGPFYLFGLPITGAYRFVAVIIGFSLNYAAYFAEIYRAGIESIPLGQYEAAFVLGLTKAQTFFRIILPQVVKRIVPPVTNEVITLVKDTSLAFAISVAEMFTAAKVAAAAGTTMVPFIVAGLFYYVFNFAVAWGMERVEKSLDYYR